MKLMMRFQKSDNGALKEYSFNAYGSKEDLIFIVQSIQDSKALILYTNLIETDDKKTDAVVAS